MRVVTPGNMSHSTQSEQQHTQDLRSAERAAAVVAIDHDDSSVASFSDDEAGVGAGRLDTAVRVVGSTASHQGLQDKLYLLLFAGQFVFVLLVRYTT